MGKNAYLIISDLHKSYKNFRNRYNYDVEIGHVQQQIVDTAKKYKLQGYDVTLLLLGDVFHNSYNDVFRAVHDNNFFILMSEVVGKIYSVLGNHELSYYSSNPFYTLVSEIRSQKVQAIMNRVWTPRGIVQAISVVDELVDGDVVFHFNHYSTPVTDPVLWERQNNREGNGCLHVGLFHQDFASKAVVDLMRRRLDINFYAEPIEDSALELLNAYSYCFFGHMHSVYGTFLTDAGTRLCYLASLGRTNEKEVNDNFLERNIPAILVEDGRFASADDNVFQLLSRSECVKEAAVAASHEQYEVQKARKQIKGYAPVSDDPRLNVEAMLAGSPQALQIFHDYLGSEISSIGQAVDQEISEVNNLLAGML